MKSQGIDHDNFYEASYTWTLKHHMNINSPARIWKTYFHLANTWQAMGTQIEAS